MDYSINILCTCQYRLVGLQLQLCGHDTLNRRKQQQTTPDTIFFFLRFMLQNVIFLQNNNMYFVELFRASDKLQCKF